MDTWDEIERMWLQAQHSERTRKSYSFAWRDFQAWSQKYPSDITVKDVVEYRDKLLKAGLSQATARVRLSAVGNFFRYALGKGVVAADPTAGVQRPTGIVYTSALLLTSEQVSLLLELPDQATLVGRRDYALLVLILTAGFRRSELIGLRFDDLVENDEHMELHYHPTVGQTHVCVLTQPAAKAVASYLALRGTVNREDPLFVAHDRAANVRPNQPLHPHSLNSIVARYTCQALGHPLSPQQLRHCGAAIQWAVSRDPKAVQQFLRHKNIATTQTYLRQLVNNAGIP